MTEIAFISLGCDAVESRAGPARGRGQEGVGAVRHRLWAFDGGPDDEHPANRTIAEPASTEC